MGESLPWISYMLRGRSLANRCCMCYCNEESVDHLLLHCPMAHSLWVHMLQFFDGRLCGKLGLLELLGRKI